MHRSPDLPFAETKASILLDLLRGLASVLVLSTHWRNLLFVDFRDVQASHKLLLAPMYVLTSNGHRAVVVFFVLSGYLIGASVMRAVRRRTWSWTTYMLQRLVRLWVVLLPGLLLCCVWDRLGLWLNRAPAVYGGLNGDHVTHDAALAGHLSTLLANAVFLQGVRAYVYGSNTPLWSLANEFWYYLLFPLAVLSLLPSTPLRRRIRVAVMFLVVAVFVGKGVLLGFPMWLAGVALIWLPRAPDSAVLRWGALLLLLVCFFGLPVTSVVGNDWCIAVLATAAIWTFLGARQPCDAGSRATLTSRALARFSFTLYVVHMPLLVLLTSLVQGDTRWQPSVRHVGVAFVLLLLTLAYAWLVASLTEFHTDAVRAAVTKRLALRAALPSLHARKLEAATTALQ